MLVLLLTLLHAAQAGPSIGVHFVNPPIDCTKPNESPFKNPELVFSPMGTTAELDGDLLRVVSYVSLGACRDGRFKPIVGRSMREGRIVREPAAIPPLWKNIAVENQSGQSTLILEISWKRLQKRLAKKKAKFLVEYLGTPEYRIKVMTEISRRGDEVLLKQSFQ